MRIIIDIEGYETSIRTTDTRVHGQEGQNLLAPLPPGSASAHVLTDMLKAATASGAQNAGPAPALHLQAKSAPMISNTRGDEGMLSSGVSDLAAGEAPSHVPSNMPTIAEGGAMS